MRIIPNTAPQPRLTNSVEAPVTRRSRDASGPSDVRLERAGLFTGNGRAIWVGLAIGGILLPSIGFLVTRHPAVREEAPHPVKLVAVETDAVSSAARPTELPSAHSMQVTEDLLRVTAISLGHPRLAVINGTQVAEGDFLSVQSAATRSVSVQLRVLKIGDGRIELTDGTQVIHALLAVPKRSVAK